MALRLSVHVLLPWSRVCQFGSWVWTWHCLASDAVAGVPHRKWRKTTFDVSSGPVFLSKKRRIGSRCYLRANLPPKKERKRKQCQAHSRCLIG